jgi:hypothetical protein
MKWFIAQVVDPASDPAQAGSVKIRIQGHQDNISDDNLRNAKPMFDVTNPIDKKVGGPVTGLMKGSQVIGFFMDGETGQVPVIMGSIGSEGEKPENGKVDYTKGDTPVAHKEKQNKRGEKLGGGDYRLIPGDDRLDPKSSKLDSKSILKYAKDEAKNPFEETYVHADDGEETYGMGQEDPAAA